MRRPELRLDDLIAFLTPAENAKPNFGANDEQLIRWPFVLGNSYWVALFHSSFCSGGWTALRLLQLREASQHAPLHSGYGCGCV
jgi:hypothetical protein